MLTMSKPLVRTKLIARVSTLKDRIKSSAGKMSSTVRLMLPISLLLFCTQMISPSAGYYHYQQQQLPSPDHHQQQQQQLAASQVQPLESLLSSQQQQGNPSNLNSNNDQENHQQPQQQPAHQGSMIRFFGSALNSSTIRLRWSLRNGYNYDYFDIFYGPMPDATHSFSVIKINGTSREYTFHNLQPDTEYQFEIRLHEDSLLAVTSGTPKSPQFKPQFAVVRTPPLNQASGRGLQDSINRDIMPLGVKAEAKSNNSIQLSWTEPERPINFRNSNRVNIIRYYINPSLLASQMQASSSSNESSSNISSPQYHYLNVTNARDSKLIIQRLKPATEYAFAVKTAYYTPDMKKLYTQSGFSMDTVAKTFDLEPSAPKNFTIQVLPPSKSDGGAAKNLGSDLELNWSPPDSPNGQLKGYVILYTTDRNTPDSKWEAIEANGNTTTNWYIKSLTPGYSYHFKVRAVNQKGLSPDSETHSYFAPMIPPVDKFNMPIPANNVLLIIAICMLAILFVLSLLVSKLACGSRRKPRKGSLNQNNQQKAMASGALSSTQLGAGAPKLNGFAATNSSSTVAARVGTLARRRDQNNNNTSLNGKPDFWISAMDQQQADVKSNISEKSNSDLNMAMVSIQRDSPQFATTTQLAPALPEYRFAGGAPVDPQQQHLIQQLQQSHYHPGQFTGQLAFDQMDNATANALMTLSKRQQQQLQKYQIQFASTTGVPSSMASNFGTISTMGNQTIGGLSAQAPSPHQQPPPPPPLSIEAQQQQQQQSLYGTHQTLSNTRSLRMHRPTLYDPVSGSFVQGGGAGTMNTSATDSIGPPNYNSHNHNQVGGMMMSSTPTSFGNNTLQFHSHHHPHQTSTLLSRRSTNTLRSFQNSGGNQTYGQIGMTNAGVQSTFGNMQPMGGNTNGGQPPMMQGHQAVINQLNNSSYPSLPLKHVSTVRPQIMSSLEDQIEMELAEKEQQLNQQQQQQQHQQQQAQPTLQSPGAIKQ